ncbi:hypothetical protein XENOCAPTIV_016345 [Xenoophorus captivus]|uniref:Laminin EGF-like domain-containing protein n=1 Tax=Xenoophorus captivus TaxID=1517983 RepID=A0ABV0R937_9TELE
MITSTLDVDEVRLSDLRLVSSTQRLTCPHLWKGAAGAGGPLETLNLGHKTNCFSLSPWRLSTWNAERCAMQVGWYFKNGGLCDSHSDPSLGMVGGQCRCKANVEGPRCDKCKTGYFGLSADNPVGCQPCRCDHRGTVLGSSMCDAFSGDCFCKRLVIGRSCDQCLVRLHKGLFQVLL